MQDYHVLDGDSWSAFVMAQWQALLSNDESRKNEFKIFSRSQQVNVASTITLLCHVVFPAIFSSALTSSIL